jgi:CHAD domain-containing protein
MTAMSDRPTETELKYRVADPATGKRLLGDATLGPLHARGPARTIQHEDHYVDTADWALTRAGFAARLRQSAEGTIISVKSLRSSGEGAMHRREELEGAADRAVPPHDWPGSAARSLILELGGDAPLVELVTLRQLRRMRRYGVDATEVELSLDEVDVVDRGRIVERFVELEVELVAGDAAPLEALQATLASEVGLEPSAASKFEHALAAAGISPAPEPLAAGVEAVAAGVRGSSATVAAAAPSAGSRRSRSTGRRGGRAGPSGRAQPSGRTARGEGATGNGAGGDSTDAKERRETDPGSDRPDRPPGSSRAPATVDSMAAGSEESSVDAAIDAPATEIEGEGPADIAPEGEAESGIPKLVVGKSPGVQAEDTLAEAGRKVLRFHLARMLAREPGTRLGAEPEELHGMRVATRRMRAAWRVFGDAYRPGRTRRYRRDLRDVAARLGAVRDLDVLIDGLASYQATVPASDRQAFEPLMAAWRTRREEARVLLLRTLDSGRYLRFVEQYREFVQTDGLAVLPVSPTTPHRVRDSMPSRIWAAYEHVRAFEPVLRWADVETLHELRIAAKWLRYTIEFVREPLGAEATPLIERVVALQDHLGYLHDADVAANLARTYLVEHAGELSEAETAAIARYLVERERELQRLRRTVGAPWRRVAGLAYRRSLGRVIAGL